MIRNLSKSLINNLKYQKLGSFGLRGYSQLLSNFNSIHNNPTRAGFSFMFSFDKQPPIQDFEFKTFNDFLNFDEFENLSKAEGGKHFIDYFSKQVEKKMKFEDKMSAYLFEIQLHQDKIVPCGVEALCDKAIELCEKEFPNYEEQMIIKFKNIKGQALANLGRTDEIIQLADESRELFKSAKDSLDINQRIQAYKDLAELFLLKNDLNAAEMFSRHYYELIMKTTNEKNRTPEHIFVMNFQLSLCYFASGKFKKSLKYGFVAAEQIHKIQNKDFEMYSLLTNMSLSLYCIGNSLLSDVYIDLALNLLNQMPFQSEIDDIEEERRTLLSLREKFFIDQQNLENIRSFEKGNSDNIWNEETDLGFDLKELGADEEAIQYYQQKVELLNPETDLEKIITIHGHMAHLYSEMNDNKQALHLAKEAHNKLLKLRSSNIVADELSFQVLLNLMTFFFKAKDYEKTIEWGEKWESVCRQLKLFEKPHQDVEQGIVYFIGALKQLGYYKECLEYLNDFSERLQTFHSDDMPYHQFLQNLKFKLFSSNKDINSFLQSSIEVYQSTKNQSKEDESTKLKIKSYQYLKMIVDLSLQLEDDKNIFKYGVEFLEQQPIYDKKQQYNQKRYSTEMNIGRVSYKNGDYQMAQDYFNKALHTSQKLANKQQQLCTLIYLAQVYTKQQKSKKALSVVDQASKIMNKLVLNQKDNEHSYSIARILTIIYHQQKDYRNCLKQIDRCFEMQNNIPATSQNEIQTLINLLQQLKLEVKDKDSVVAIAKKHKIELNK